MSTNLRVQLRLRKLLTISVNTGVYDEVKPYNPEFIVVGTRK